jgi:3-oxoadipate enol-lactonase
MARLAVDGAELFYDVSGTGDAVVLIHAGGVDSRMRDHQVKSFAQHYRVVRYDTRGIGQSHVVDRDRAFSNQQDLRDLLGSLGVERAHIVGASGGGSLAIDFAIESPRLVNALVLVAPGLSGYIGTSAEVERFDQDQTAALERGDVEAAVELTLRLWLDGPRRSPDLVDPALRRWVGGMYRHSFQQAVGTGPPQPMDPPALDRLNELTAPTLVVVGDLDTDMMHAIADLLAARVQGARKVTIHGGGHMVSMEQPVSFDSVVLEFLASQSKDSRSPGPADCQSSGPAGRLIPTHC